MTWEAQEPELLMVEDHRDSPPTCHIVKKKKGFFCVENQYKKTWQALKQQCDNWCSHSCLNLCAVLTWQESFCACGGGSVASMLQKKKKRCHFYDKYLLQQPATASRFNLRPPRVIQFLYLVLFMIQDHIQFQWELLKMHSSKYSRHRKGHWKIDI